MAERWRVPCGGHGGSPQADRRGLRWLWLKARIEDEELGGDVRLQHRSVRRAERSRRNRPETVADR
jgi:hypothetical protein